VVCHYMPLPGALCEKIRQPSLLGHIASQSGECPAVQIAEFWDFCLPDNPVEGHPLLEPIVQDIRRPIISAISRI